MRAKGSEEEGKSGQEAAEEKGRGMETDRGKMTGERRRDRRGVSMGKRQRGR